MPGLGDCAICLDEVTDAVATQCGHVFCWACLFRHLRTREDCPTCKAYTTEANIIPLYGRGRSHGEGAVPARPDAPARPPARAPVAPPLPIHAHLNFAISFGFFPAILTLLLAGHSTGRPRGQDLTADQLRLRFIERSMLFSGAAIVFCILFI